MYCTYIQGLLFCVILIAKGYEVMSDNNDLTGKILGGTKASAGEFPWQVAVWKKNKTTQVYLQVCGGSIIGREWVLTAAQCLYDSDAFAFFIEIGKTNLNEVEPYQRKLFISKFILHPEWNNITSMNNIALMKLSHPLVYNHDVGRITLSKPGKDYSNLSCIASGWGLEDNNKIVQGIFSGIVLFLRIPYLQKSTFKIWPYDTCKENPQSICVGGDKDGGKGPCIGDMGGPFQCLIDGEYRQVGILSHGLQCGVPNKADYFPNISYYHDWITEIIIKNTEYTNVIRFNVE